MDKGLFEYIEGNLAKILSLDFQSIEQIVSRSCKDKASIVEQDEKEQNIRAILNYGHTVGHSIEAVADYGVYRHGEAVSMGMVVAARIAVNMGLMDEVEASRQNKLLADSGLPTKFPDLDIGRIIETIRLDKKVKDNRRIRFALAKEIGKAIVVENVTDEQIREAIMESR